MSEDFPYLLYQHTLSALQIKHFTQVNHHLAASHSDAYHVSHTWHCAPYCHGTDGRASDMLDHEQVKQALGLVEISKLYTIVVSLAGLQGHGTQDSC